MSDKSGFFFGIAAPLAVAALLAIGGVIANAASHGAVAQMLGAPTASTDPVSFSSPTATQPIPGAGDAKYCAVTRIAYGGGNNAASCRVSRDPKSGTWTMEAVGVPNNISCEVTCLR